MMFMIPLATGDCSLANRTLYTSLGDCAQCKLTVCDVFGLILCVAYCARKCCHCLEWVLLCCCIRDKKVCIRMGDCRRWSDGQNRLDLVMGFDQEAAAVVMARLATFKMEDEEDFDATRWIDRTLIRLASRWGFTPYTFGSIPDLGSGK